VRFVPNRWTIGALLLVGVVVIGALVYGAWSGFPVLNDAYLVGFVREQGPRSILADHPDQPLYGLLLQSFAMAFGWSRAPYVLIGVASWILLAWQASRLWKRVYPEDSRLGLLAALLVVSPILVETQYTTVTAILRANLPVSLCLAALLVCLGSEKEDRRSLALSAALVLVAAAMTEYGLGAMAACATLLILLRRFRSAGALAAGGVAGYLVFRITADVGTVKYVDPKQLLPIVLGDPASTAARWITGVWYSLAGAWFSAAGSVSIYSTSRSTLLAAVAGALAAFVIVRSLGGAERHSASERPPGRLVSLCLAVAVGLIPVVLANRAANLPMSDSRHRTHVLVFAAAAFLALISRIAAIRYRKAAFGFLSFLAIYWVVVGAFQTRRDQKLLEQVGNHLLPLVRSSSGITVAVLPGQTVRTDLTPKATIRWSDEEAKRAWILLPDEAVTLFGPRMRCRDTDRIDTPPELHSTGRRGPVSYLVWVSMAGDGVESLESYCVQPVLTDQPRTAPRS
jgi:hypothetical protein